MHTIDFRNEDENFKKHDCISYQIDDWLVFDCPTCDYVRRFNWKTKEMKVKGGSLDTLHNGFHAPVEVPSDFDINRN